MKCFEKLDGVCCFVAEDQASETVLPQCEFDAFWIDAKECDVTRRTEMSEENAERI